MYKRLFIIVEGPDDGRFFSRIIKPVFENNYECIDLWENAQKVYKKTCKFIRSINSMSSANFVADYIFVTDINNSPCVSHKKMIKKSQFSDLDGGKILVIKKEIESWFLAGLDRINCKKCRIPNHSDTEKISKEQFNNMIPKKFRDSRIDFLHELLNYFQIEVAKEKNASFKYFIEKYISN
ncbi:MAG: hypothetical protein JW845_08505 [Dehalococcoidales bacterium]|nr:hypothetical protein [Dehalococcoidales bacterium]